MKRRGGNLNGELQYVKAGLAAPWTPAELETMRAQAERTAGPAAPVAEAPAVLEDKKGGRMMETPESRAPDGAFPHYQPHYENDEGMALLAELAARREGVSLTELLRLLTREEAGRTGLMAVMSHESRCAVFEQARRDSDISRGG
jgi:hypothetical protein